MKHWLIADSGGTSTTWVYGNSKELGRVETASLHPRNINLFPMKDKELLRRLFTDFSFEQIDFYGAGMSSVENQALIRSFFNDFNVSGLSVYTDALAAGLACCGFDHGYTAILGTGSILLEMNKGRIVARKGGLGPGLGDEGSAFYFGKLLIEEVQHGFWDPDLSAMFRTPETFLEHFQNANPSVIASLASKVVHLNFRDLHRKNLQLFIEQHGIMELPNNTKIGVVGSYGYHLKQLLKEEFSLINIGLSIVLQNPVDKLVDLMLSKKVS